jgi:hypothetical protein
LDDLTMDRAEVLQLVAQLRGPDYRKRQRAMRELSGYGLGVLPILDALDPESLDAEQRHRLAQVRAELRIAAGDSPERVASWLRCDRTMWLTLLASPEPKTSELASEHLSRLYARPISFAHVASDQDRARQIQRVRNQLERR